MGNIPDLASIIVVPKSLHPQFTRELRRYLAPKSFDILPYTGRQESRSDFWTGVWNKSAHSPGRRILIATTGVSVPSSFLVFGLHSTSDCRLSKTMHLALSILTNCARRLRSRLPVMHAAAARCTQGVGCCSPSMKLIKSAPKTHLSQRQPDCANSLNFSSQSRQHLSRRLQR